MNDKRYDTLSIGQFAQASQLSLKALRIYHEQGLLEPDQIDPDSGYRYYTVYQLRTAELIRLLRAMEMPLSMVRQVLENYRKEPVVAHEVINTYLRLFAERVAVVQQTANVVVQLLQTEESPMSNQDCRDQLPRSLDLAGTQATLKIILEHISPVLSPNQYRLVGTAAALLHGVTLPARGVDFIMQERAAIDAFHLAMSPFACTVQPIHLPEDKQYWAAYTVNEVEVAVSTVEWETSSDAIECFGVGPWQHFTLLPCGIYNVPTVNLELRLVTELCRNRPECSTPLIRAMKRRADLELVKRGMNERQIDPATQEDVLRQLVGA